jgi:hypothetical protein
MSLRACWVMPPQAILGQTAMVRRAIIASNFWRGVGGAVDMLGKIHTLTFFVKLK